MHNIMTTSEEAGQAIAAGGFGCVFYPPISCNIPAGLDKKKYLKLLKENPYITKLLIKKYADEEMAEVNKILPIVKTIPNYKNYFLLDDIFSCENFGPLTSEDFKKFSKCNNLIKKGYSTANINSKLNTLGTIYIPDGGISVKRLIDNLASLLKAKRWSHADLINLFGLLSWGLVALLQNAIIPMNKKGLIHMDLKTDNMMIKTEQLTIKTTIMPEIKLIDWGLAGIIASPTDDPIEEIKNRPFQFNAPFGNVLFNERLSDILYDFRDIIGSTDPLLDGIIPDISIKSLAAYILDETISGGLEGHIGWMKENLFDIFQQFNVNKLSGYAGDGISNKFNVNNSCFASNTLFYSFFIEYLATILNKYLVRNSEGFLIAEFDAKAYFQEVYRYNCDIWGLLTTYQDFLLVYVGVNYANILSVQITNLLMKYLYNTTYAATRIPTDQLIKDLSEFSSYYRTKPTSSKHTEHPAASASALASASASALVSHPPTSRSIPLSSQKLSKKSSKKSSKKPLSIIKKKPTKKKKLVLKTKTVKSPIKRYSAFSSPPIILNAGNRKLVKSAKLVGRLKKSRKRCPKGWKSGLIKGKGLRCIKK